MSLVDQVQAIIDALPSDDASVTLSRLDLKRMVGADCEAPIRLMPKDLSVREVAEEIGRAPSTVRDWLAAGKLVGAYKLNDRDWRVPRLALDEFLDRQRSLDAHSPDDEDSIVDIGAWRDVQGV